MKTVLLTAAVIVLMGAGCPPKPPQPVHMVADAAAPDLAVPIDAAACVMTALPTVDDVCDGLFTMQGYACVKCPGVGGCVDTTDGVYCALGQSCSDVHCAPPQQLQKPKLTRHGGKK